MNNYRNLSNRKVYARLRLPPESLKEDVEAAFEARNWSFKGDGEKYLIAIPLYCARSAAVYIARNALNDFRRYQAPLFIDEIRLLHAPADRRRLVSVSRWSGSWINIIPSKFRKADEISIAPLHWEVYVPRSDDKNLRDRRNSEHDRAKELLRSSQLPGEVFETSTMKLDTRSEPRNTPNNPWDHPVRNLLLLMACVGGALLAIIGAIVPWLDIPYPFRLAGPIVASLAVIGGGIWLTGDRLNQWARACTIILLLALIGLFGLIAAINIPNLGQIFPAVAIALILIIVTTGWVHLVILHPRIKSLWTIPVLTVIVAAASIYTQFLLSAWGAEFGISAEAIAIPGWFQVFATAFVILCVGGAVLILGALFGWVDYFGATSGPQFSRIFAYLMAALISVVWVLSGVMISINASTWAIDGLRERLAQDQSYALTSDFLYRACLEPDLNTPYSGTLPTTPVALVQGKNDSLWIWDVQEDDAQAPMAEPVEPAGVKVVRVSDGETNC